MRASIQVLPALGLAICMAALQGCGGTPKSQYFASAQQPRVNPEDAAAQAAAPDTPSSINTQDTYLKLIDRMQQEGLWFASLAHIDALEQRWGRTPESIHMRADALRNTGQENESGELYRQLMGTSLEGAGYHGLGLLAGARGDYVQAVNMLQLAQRKHPTDALLLSDLGYANLRAGRISEARVPLMQALQLRPDGKQIQVNLAVYLHASHQPDKADALMDAHDMPEATRSAIRETARRIAIGSPSPSNQAAPASVQDDSQVPLRLRASGWSGRSGTRTPDQSANAGNPASSSLGATR